jgi:transcription elongation factor Elf1
VTGGHGTPLPEDYQSKFACPHCGSRNYIVVKFPRMHFFCRECETSFYPN